MNSRGFLLFLMAVRFVETGASQGIPIQGAGWLLLLAPFFFVTYAKVNQFTASARYPIPMILGAWYLAGNLPFSLFRGVLFLTGVWIWFLWAVNTIYLRTSFEQCRLVRRLVLASVIACVGFLLFPTV